MLAVKTYTLIILFLVSITVPAYSQLALSQQKDSLRLQIKKLPVDTNTVLAYISMGQLYEENLPDTAIYYYQRAKQVSEQLHYTTGILKYISNYTAVLNVQGKFDESLRLNLQAVALSEKYGTKKQLYIAYANVGTVYQNKDDKTQAVAWYLKALPLLEQEGNRTNLGLFYSNLCALYKDLGQFEKSISAGLRSLSIGESLSDEHIIASASTNLGNVYEKTGQLETAFAYMNRTYKIGKKLQSLFFEEAGLLGQAYYYQKKQRPEKYIALFRQALPLADSIADIRGTVNCLYGIGMGYFFTRQFDSAYSLLQKGTAFARQYELKEELLDLYLGLSDIMIAKGKLEGAEQLRARYDSLKNQIAEETTLKNIQELETRYEVQKKQNEILAKNLLIQKKNADAVRQRNWLFLLVSAVCFLLVLVIFIYFFYRQKQKLDRQQIEAIHKDQENIRLKATVEGQAQERTRISQEMHDDMGTGLTSLLFLSHSLNDPSSAISTQQISKKLTDTASSLIQKMNEIIWMMNDQHSTLQDLLAYMRVHIVETLDNAGIPCRFTVPKDLPSFSLSQKQRRNIYLIVNEAVHNIIKHASASQAIIFIEFNNHLLISIADNGKGIDLNNTRQFGNGLRNMQARAEEIGGQVHICAAEGTKLEVKIPLGL